MTFTARGALRYLGLRPDEANGCDHNVVTGVHNYRRLLGSLARLALRRPSLVLPLLAAAWRFRRRAWYRTPPFLPLPPHDYIAWRLHTAYGADDVIPPARDLARYLRWARRVRQTHRSRVP